MNAFHSIPNAWLAGLIVIGGCPVWVAGGGGGGGGGGDDRIAITSTNAEQIAGMTATVPMGIASLGGLPEQIFTTPEPVITTSLGAPHSAGLAGYVLDQVPRAARSLADAGRVTAAVSEPEIIACETGQVVLTVDDADGDQVLSVGDSATVVMEDCQDVELGGTVTGSITLEFTALSGDVENFTPPYSMGVTARFKDFATAYEDTSLTINGDMGITAGSDDGTHFTLSISGDSLAAVETGPGADSRSLRDYVFAFTEHTGTGEQTFDGHGDLRSEELGGSVHFTIPTPYSELMEEHFPHSGVMVVTGSGDSRLTITVLDATQVRLDTDEDGDGTPEATVTVLWQTLDE
jgi:hypothetical protein